MPNGKLKRAITLGGGGPAAGLHIGVLEALAETDIVFDVWALSCIGAWVGIVYNQFDQKKFKTARERAEQTAQFFRNGVFRDDESYERFPINTVFGPDWGSVRRALSKFVRDPNNYNEFLWDPYKIADSFQDSLALLFDQLPAKVNKKKFQKLDEGDINKWILNQWMAPNPVVRYLTSMMYLSNLTGLSRINYPDSQFMKNINFEALKEKKPDADKPEDKKPFIFHNAWNLDDRKLALFCNKEMKDEAYVGGINASTLCACSALPFIEETVEMNGKTYCEGALVDTVNFQSLLEEHADLDEIWISRIVDTKQIRKPDNLHDSLANLCQLFAASVGEDDVKLFKYHVKYDEPRKWKGTVVEIHVPAKINFKWNHSNLEHGRALGKAAAKEAIAAYEKAGRKSKGEIETVRFINESPAKDRKVRAAREEHLKRREIDEDRLKQAILKVKPRMDRALLSQKMHWQVDAEGKKVEPNDEGEYPRGSVPYPYFVLDIPEVRTAYEGLTPHPDPSKI
jgi:predicted acylesterase/phospholipase RssA